MTLQGKRILVVEDEYLIAIDIKRELSGLGAEVVGPVADLSAGLALAQERQIDAAVLDLNLAGTWSYPIADRLDTKGVPYLFLTGYDNWAMPGAYAGKPSIAKPCALSAVTDKVARLCAGENAR